MSLLESALIKIDGKYPTIKNKPLWTLVAYNDATGKYDRILTELFPYNLTSSSMDVKHNAAGSTVISLRDVETYKMIVAAFKTETLLFIRETDIRQWFVLDSASISKEQDSDAGIEMWSYDITCLDATSLLDYVPLVNNKYVTVPNNPPEGYELPGNYLKLALGTGTEVEEGSIVHTAIQRQLYRGYVIDPAEPVIVEELKFIGLKQPYRVMPDNPVYSPAKTSWINTECGETTVMDKLADLNYACPILGKFEDDQPTYVIHDSPNTITFQGVLSNKVMASYTAGFEHSEDQQVVGLTGTYPAICIRKRRTNSPTPYMKFTSVKQDIGDDLTYSEGHDQINSLVAQKLTKADIQRFIDTQVSTLLQPYSDFILGDVLQIQVSDIEGFDLINLMVIGIQEAIEEDAITYTLTLEELEDSYELR